jgi:hypothetical protein
LSWIIFQRIVEEFSQEIDGMQFHRTQENVAEEELKDCKKIQKKSCPGEFSKEYKLFQTRNTCDTN